MLPVLDSFIFDIVIGHHTVVSDYGWDDGISMVQTTRISDVPGGL